MTNRFKEKIGELPAFIALLAIWQGIPWLFISFIGLTEKDDLSGLMRLLIVFIWTVWILFTMIMHESGWKPLVKAISIFNVGFIAVVGPVILMAYQMRKGEEFIYGLPVENLKHISGFVLFLIIVYLVLSKEKPDSDPQVIGK